MPLVAYTSKKLGALAVYIISLANEIIEEYQDQGLDLTLRQLYYQFVQRDLFPEDWADKETGSTNNERSYKRLGDIIGKGRLAGLVDWSAITDRTRMLRKRAEWSSPNDILRACASQFRIDVWQGQKYRPEVWIEKDAMLGNFEGVCEENGVGYFSCRGYTSLSELWQAARRLVAYVRNGQTPVILHFGDHDPSGVDMTRDIMSRVGLFMLVDLGVSAEDAEDPSLWPFEVRRLALNMPQIKKHKPPPNPAKITDSRAAKYIAKFGRSSWELDALNPTLLRKLVVDELAALRDTATYQSLLEEEEKHRQSMQSLSLRYDEVAEWLSEE